MATIGTVTTDKAPLSVTQTPDNYTTLDQIIKANKDFVLPDLVQSYGDQGITGFLNLVGAVKGGGTNDQVNWWESGRRHKAVDYTAIGNSTDLVTFTVASGEEGNYQANDVIMDSVTGIRYIVTDVATDTAVKGYRLDGTSDTSAATRNGKLIHLGNMYAQGTAQPSKFSDPDIKEYKNPFMIVKDRYQVNGSQATNIGWINLGGGDYRWFMYGEGEARKRFEDRRELMMLFGEIRKKDSTGTALTDADTDNALTKELAGSQGYVSAVEERGIVVSNANANPMDSFSEFDDLILQLDKQGAPSEYAMYLNRKQDLAIDDMLATGISTGVTAGLAGQFGAFNNDPNMAVQLGFKSFTRGGYTFHKHDWKLLNDPTLMGATNYLQGAMIPLANITDARSGAKSPSLAMYYKEANGYSREMDHWVTGGGVMGHANNGDTGEDTATFHYRSEIALVTRAANQHVIIKG